MTSPSNADRTRASRLRARIKSGKRVSANERAWLDRYESARTKTPRRSPQIPRNTGGPRAGAPAAPVASEDAPPAPLIASDTIAIIEADDAPPQPPAAAPASAATTTPAGATTPGGLAPTLHATTCTIPNCPGCAGLLDYKPQICATTQREVYPPLSDLAARGMARFVFGAIALAVKLWRRIADGVNVPMVAPTKIELAELADAIKEIVRRRVGWAGAWGDLSAAFMAITAFGARAVTAAPLPADASPAAPDLSEAA